MLDDGFITAHFHVFPRKAESQPHQRIEPVQAQSGVAQQLPEGVAPADMVPLMGNDEPALIHRGAGGQVDSGPEYTHDEGGGNVVSKKDFLLQRCRFRQSAPQNQVLDNAVCCHDGCPSRPNTGGDLHGRGLRLRLRCRLCGGRLLPDRRGSVLPDRLGNALIGHGTDAGSGAHREGLQHGQSGGDGQGAQQPEQHHRPEGVGIDFRRPF